MLPIEELKGTKPTVSIDLYSSAARPTTGVPPLEATSHIPQPKALGEASAKIVAACIRDNAVLQTLK